MNNYLRRFAGSNILGSWDSETGPGGGLKVSPFVSINLWTLHGHGDALICDHLSCVSFSLIPMLREHTVLWKTARIAFE